MYRYAGAQHVQSWRTESAVSSVPPPDVIPPFRVFFESCRSLEFGTEIKITFYWY